jgi:ferric-dicitrate binding protein FerR (iron transport regulator)
VGGAAERKAHVSVPTVDQAVQELLASLHVEKSDHAKSLGAVKEASKHHAAQHVQKVGSSGGWKKPLALVVVLGGLIFLGLRWVNKSSVEMAVNKALAAEDARTLSSQRGQRGTVDLSDGSKAKIGSDSKLKLPVEFGGTMRTLQLTGTASFAVAAGQPLPFTVRALNTVITATGTKFTVRAFEEDSTVVVGVEEGSVSVKVKDSDNEKSLDAGKTARVAKDGTISDLDAAAGAAALSWVRDTLEFVNAPVSVVLPELIRWFDLKASLADPSLGSRPVTMRIGLQSSGDALKSMATAANLSIGFDKDDKVVLSDAGAAPATPPKKK